MLDNERLIPRELIFLVRSQRMLQAANQSLGSPSNRVALTARSAARGFALTSPLSTLSLYEVGLRRWVRGKRDLWLFGFALSVIDIGFWLSKIQQCECSLFSSVDPLSEANLSLILQGSCTLSLERRRVESKSSCRFVSSFVSFLTFLFHHYCC